jgi:hypothetical protein
MAVERKIILYGMLDYLLQMKRRLGLVQGGAEGRGEYGPRSLLNVSAGTNLTADAWTFSCALFAATSSVFVGNLCSGLWPFEASLPSGRPGR